MGKGGRNVNGLKCLIDSFCVCFSFRAKPFRFGNMISRMMISFCLNFNSRFINEDIKLEFCSMFAFLKCASQRVEKVMWQSVSRLLQPPSLKRLGGFLDGFCNKDKIDFCRNTTASIFLEFRRFVLHLVLDVGIR